jgi:low affinity Fe/Cu permease
VITEKQKITLSESVPNFNRKTKNNTVGISSKFQQQNRRKRDNIDIHVNNTHVHNTHVNNTHVHDHSLSRLGTVTLIKTGGVKLLNKI